MVCAASVGHVWVCGPMAARDNAVDSGLCYHWESCELLGPILMWVACVVTGDHVSVLGPTTGGHPVDIYGPCSIKDYSDLAQTMAESVNVNDCGLHCHQRPCWGPWLVQMPENLWMSVLHSALKTHVAVHGLCSHWLYRAKTLLLQWYQ